MIVLFTIFSILGYTTLLHIILKRHLELSLFVTIAGIVAALYLSVFLGYLRFAAQSVFYLGVILMILNLILYALKYRQLGKDFLSPGIVIFIGLSVLYWLRFNEMTYGEDGDVLSHWGLVTKEMLLTHTFIGADSPISLQDYPPGAHLFHYFVAFNTMNKEGTIFFAHFLFLVAPLVGFLKGVSWRQPLRIVLIVATVFYLIHALGLGVITLRIDHIVSVYFAMILVFYFTSQWKKTDFILLMPILFVMPLIKNAASFLGILAVLLITADLVLSSILKFWRNSSPFLSGPFSLKKEIVWAVGIGGLLCFSAILSDFSWNQRIESSGSSKNFRPPRLSLDQMTNAFSESASETKKTTIKNFLNVMVQPNLGEISDKNKIFAKIREVAGIELSQWKLLNRTVTLSILERVGIIWLVFIVAFFLQPSKELRIRIILALVSLSLAFTAFLFSLLTYYLFVFGDYEGTRVMSAYRYVNTFLLAFNLIAFGFIFPNGWAEAEKTRKNELIAYSFCGILMVLLFVFTPPASRGFLSRQPGYIASRQMTQPQIEFILSKVAPGGKVYVIYQPLDEAKPLVAKKGIQYDLSPLYALVPCSSLGKPYFPGDIWTCDWSMKQWADYLEKNQYTHVYLAKVDDFFWENYGGLFDEKSKSTDFLFKLRQGKLNEPLLVPIQ